MLVFLSGPYNSTDQKQRETNICTARLSAIELWSRGIPTICPHLNTQNFDRETKIPEEVFYRGYCKIITFCTHVVMLKNWKLSKGAVREHDCAKINHVPIYYSLEEFLKIWEEGDCK